MNKSDPINNGTDMMSQPAGLIALDWGTSNLRAYLLSKCGHILAERQDGRGILNVPDQDFESVLFDLTADWQQTHQHIPLIAAGMITSKQGWHETEYLPCPVDVNELAKALSARALSNGDRISFVPGLSFDPPDGWPDVMRGEEVQILGAANDTKRGLFVLPGTHSKWASLNNDIIDSFRTFMTGEVFDVLKSHSILGRLIEGNEFDPDGFADGVRRARDSNGSILLSSLFSSRSLALFDRLPASKIESYLSGLLIGHEISEGRRTFDLDQSGVVIVGSDKLVDLYQCALAMFGIETRRLETPAAVHGLYRIAVAAGLIAID